jgi:hypothetical protein
VELSVVLPCLDEAETVAVCVHKALGSIERLGVCGEVVVADNGSTDGSQQLATQAGVRVVAVAERGYGAALRCGISAARGRYVVMADADDSYALDDLGPFLAALREGADLVMGDRFAGGVAPGAMPALHRYLGNPVLSYLGRLFFHISIHDFHCGMRGFDRQRILDLGLRTTGMEFASEMVVRASLGGLSVTEVPTTLRPDGRSRRPHLRTWRDGWRHLRFLLAFSPRWLLLNPALVLIGIGLLGMVVLITGPHQVGRVAFDVQTMLVAATAFILGGQAAGLALVSRAYVRQLGMDSGSTRFERFLDRVVLEHGVGGGLLLLLGGLGSFVAALIHWRSTGFGELSTDDLHLPLVGMVLLVTGFQMMLVSFMLSLTHIGEF